MVRCFFMNYNQVRTKSFNLAQITNLSGNFATLNGLIEEIFSELISVLLLCLDSIIYSYA